MFYRGNHQLKNVMKKLITLSLVLISFINFGISQCSMLIPPTPAHVKITSDQTLNAVGMVYWVCEGVTLDIASSPGATYVLEQNVTLNINDSDGDQVYAKDNCIINNNSTQDIGVAANTSTVTLNNNSSGSITVTAACSAVTYDYSMVGGSPCMGTTTGLSESAENDLEAYPNPVKSGEVIRLKNATGFRSLELFDYSGKKVFSSSDGSDSISTMNMAKGVYFLIATSNDRVAYKRIVIS